MNNDQAWHKDGRGLKELTDDDVVYLIWWGDMLSKEDADALEAEFNRRGLKWEDLK
jgi:hypothetical protein